MGSAHIGIKSCVPGDIFDEIWCEALSDKIRCMADRRFEMKPFSFDIKKLYSGLIISEYI